jgi:hypothetical protein
MDQNSVQTIYASFFTEIALLSFVFMPRILSALLHWDEQFLSCRNVFFDGSTHVFWFTWANADCPVKAPMHVMIKKVFFILCF